jgi:hypothetical protein
LQYNFPLEIGGHTYTVYIENKYSVDDDHNAGTQNKATCTICVSTLTMDGQPKSLSRIEEVLWHEILHAVSDHYGANLTEDQVNVTAEGLIQVFKQFNWRAIKEE